uniref:Flavin-containing monooxygenase n=1 Tax=Salarias fasciatus TaxID=181472 RepID=A0A672JII9_SALFA
MVQRVAVIGAGSSGLACIKSCVEEGLDPVCFESSDDIGGIWKFRESSDSERNRIYRSLVVNTSKEMMCFSDFPMPADYPNYMHNSQLLQYFRLYAEHFDLLRYIKFQTITPREDFPVTGQWDVVTVTQGGEEEQHIFDAILVCSGHYNQPIFPLSHLKGHDIFSGRCFHSRDYSDGDAFRGKRVVVVGVGNSGGDITVEISRAANKTFLSTREGAWVVGRMSTNGLPMDMTALTRFNSFLAWLTPKSLANWAAERALNYKYDHQLYGLKPKHRLLEKRPLINDDLPGRIFHGAVVMKSNLTGFTESGVVFEDGTVEENIDMVVFCTGYQANFPFLPSSLSDGPNGNLTLYKRVFPLSLEQPTLAIMGLFQSKGPIMTTVEIQARWAARVFCFCQHVVSLRSDLTTKPPEVGNQLKTNALEKKHHSFSSCYDFLRYPYEKHAIGARPNLLKMLLRDPVLWMKVFFGPSTPYQYSLTGPGRWAAMLFSLSLNGLLSLSEPERSLKEHQGRPFWVFSGSLCLEEP